MKKIKKLLFVLTILAMLPLGVFAKEKVNVYLFKREGCMYCASALSFFENLSKDEEFQNYFTLVTKDVSNTENNNLMVKVAKKLGVTLSGVPFIVIGEEYFEGYSETYDDSLKKAIQYAYEHDSKDLIAEGNKDTSAVTILILVAIVGGIVFLIYMAKDNHTSEEEEKVDTEKKELSNEEKKTTTVAPKKKTTSTKNKTVAKKQTTSNKTSNKKTTGTKKQTATKKTTKTKTTNKK